MLGIFRKLLLIMMVFQINVTATNRQIKLSDEDRYILISIEDDGKGIPPELIKKVFPLKPADILEKLNLRRPIYKKTASYGHFGRDTFPWERLDKVDELKELANI